MISTLASDESLSFAPLFLKTVIATILILILAIVAIRYLIPRLTGHRRNQNSTIKVLDAQPLDARKMIYIVSIENKKVALGVTEHQVTKLCDLE